MRISYSYLLKMNLQIHSAWAEIHDVFGDGHEYDWALEGDDETDFRTEQLKPDMKYQDVCNLFLCIRSILT